MRNGRGKLGWMILAGVLAVPVAAAAQAQAGAGSCPGCTGFGGPGPGTTGRRAFDPATVTTIQGQVLDVQRIVRGRREGVHLVVATGSEQLGVLLGPAFYVDAQPLKLAQGDQVEVTGSRTSFGGRPVVVAQEVRRGGEVLALRDASGVPLWRGQGPGRR